MTCDHPVNFRGFCNTGVRQTADSILCSLLYPPIMAQWEKFDHIFSFNKKYSYDSKTVDQIISNRRSLEGQLFADRLLGLLGIKGGTSSVCSPVYSRFNSIFPGSLG